VSFFDGASLVSLPQQPATTYFVFLLNWTGLTLIYFQEKIVVYHHHHPLHSTSLPNQSHRCQMEPQFHQRPTYIHKFPYQKSSQQLLKSNPHTGTQAESFCRSQFRKASNGGANNEKRKKYKYNLGYQTQ
jgi:hypothetical protein